MPCQLKKNHTTTQWSGGQTTELYIYPENADYKTGNYLFRLSTATVEVEESTFTSLPGVDRTLMVLEGEMELEHKGHHSSLLGPLDSDLFKGDWITKSKGKCVDFNLMCKSGTQGEVKGYSLDENSALKINLRGAMNFIFLYNGAIKVDGLVMNSGELLIYDSPSPETNIKTHQSGRLVTVSIQ